MRRIIGNLTLPVNSALDPFLRVKLSGGYLAAAGADDQEIGVLEERSIGPPQEVAASVIPLGDPAARDGVAADVIVQYALVYAAAGGKLTDTVGTAAQLRGMAITAANGDGSHFQYVPFLQSPVNDGLSEALQSANIFVGSAQNVATGVALSGDATIDNAGALTIGNKKVTTAKINDAAVTTTQLGAGAATLPKVGFSGLKVLAHAGVAAAGAVTLTGAAVGDRVAAIFGAPTAGGALVACTPGTEFEAAITVVDQIQQKAAAGDVHESTFVFVLAPAAA